MTKLALLTIAAMLTVSIGHAAGGPLDPPADVVRALDEARDGQYTKALQQISELSGRKIPMPLARLVEAEADWGLIYCQTGRITAAGVYNLADGKTTSYDGGFFSAIDQVLSAGAASSQSGALTDNQSHASAESLLYSGMAYGLRGRLYALREQAGKSAGEGKQMRAELMEAVAKDPRLEPDADLGLGSYNYYADVLSPLLKFIRFFLGIPGGDRALGLQELQTASQQATLFGPEARWELARVLGIQEGRHAESLALLNGLSEQYPDNALFALAAGYQAEQAGQKPLALALAGKARVAAGKMGGDCSRRIAAAAQGALERLR